MTASLLKLRVLKTPQLEPMRALFDQQATRQKGLSTTWEGR
jgi:hypothetical protein